MRQQKPNGLVYLNPSRIAAPVGRYSHGVLVPTGSTLLFVSGQVGIDNDGTGLRISRVRREAPGAISSQYSTPPA
jgi:enamine deaminase RidA (YjgF/YER057c/UK114 family)